MENISNNLCSICLKEINPPLTTESSRTPRGLRAFARLIQKKEILTKLPCGHEFHHGCIKTWANKNPRCPIDRRLITKTPFISVNMRKELLRSVEEGQIDNVRDILHVGFNPNQRSLTNRKNPLSISLRQKNWEISAALIGAGATTRNKTAQNNLGYMYKNGLGVEQNHSEAVTWYRKAADQGLAAAQNNLGWMHRHGFGENHDRSLTASPQV